MSLSAVTPIVYLTISEKLCSNFWRSYKEKSPGMPSLQFVIRDADGAVCKPPEAKGKEAVTDRDDG